MAKVALVTAGGSGMGAAVAEGYAMGVLSSSGKGEALAAELGGLGVTGSNQSSEDLRRLVDGALERWGRVDALVNSGGHGPRAPVVELSDEAWQRWLEVYSLNVTRALRLVAPVMQPGAAIARQAAEKVLLSGAGIRLESGWKVACHFLALWKGFGTTRVPGPSI